MFEIYKDVICVHGGWLYSKRGANVLKKYQYDNYVRRGPYRVLRNGGGPNTPALIAWQTIQPEIQERIKAVWGDPEKTTKHIIFTDYLERDPKASKFYASYILPNGKHIAEDIQNIYSVEAAIFNAINRIVNDRVLKTKALGTGGLADTWKKLANIVQELPRHTWPHRLPKNPTSLRRRYEPYVAEDGKYERTGYDSLVHRGHGHKNSEKLCNRAKDWILARWARQDKKMPSLPQLLDAYNEHAIEQGWKTIKREKTLYNYLYDPAVKPLWYGHRYGELKAKGKYDFRNSTKMPTMRDSLWYGDGTKMNLYYLDENGKMATCQVYEVMDAFSEVLLGYHISPTEDYEAQYHAYKMATKNSGHRPYEIRFDGQGGHNKLIAGNFLGKLGRLAIKTQPYNAQSKTIESAFGRFQQQVMKKLWYFTGQNITAKSMESRQNMEFIQANAHKLPNLEEAKAEYAKLREEWNTMLHHGTKQPKLEMYYNSENPQSPKIEMLEMVDIFWIERPEPVTCTAYGITFREKKRKYTYIVYDENRLPDFNFLSENIDRKVYVKYDPDDMGVIWLYERTNLGLRKIGVAETKVVPARNKQEQDEYDAWWFKQIDNANKAKRVERRDAINAILEEHGMLPEQNGFVTPHLKGIGNKKKLSREERGLPPTVKAKPISIGEHQKEISNMDALLEETRADEW